MAVLAFVPALTSAALSAPSVEQQPSVFFEERLSVDIAAAILKTTLIKFTTQTGVQVIYEPGLIEGIGSRGVKGRFTRLEILSGLLAGTGITYKLENAKTIRLITHEQKADGEGSGSGVKLEEILVTGSRVPRAGFDLTRPANVIASGYLDDRSFTTAAPAIEQLPGFFEGDDVASSSKTTSNLGQSFPNTFGLGTSRTLVLVNGRRTVAQNGLNQLSQQTAQFLGNTINIGASINSASPGDQVDLNTISTALIDRIEIIYTGGTPAYGSGAIAGTVNVLLKDDFEGLELNSQYGISGEGDAAQGRLQATWGKNFKNNRGNITLSVDYSKENGLYVVDRPDILQGASTCFDSESFDLFICEDIATDPTIPNTGLITRNDEAPDRDLSNLLFDTAGNALILDFDGGLIRRDQTGLGPGGSRVGARAGENPYYTYSFDRIPAVPSEIVVPQSRIIVQSLGHYKVSDDARFFYEASFVSSDAHGDIRDASFSTRPEDLIIDTEGIFNRPSLQINAGENPYIGDELRESLIFNNVFDPSSSADQFFYVHRSNVDILGGRGRGRNTREQDIYRGVIGFDGEANVLSRPLSWEVAFVYGETRATLREEDINTSRLTLAVDAVRDPENSGIVCRSTLESITALPDGTPLTEADVAGCIPVNVLGLNQFDPAARGYLLQENISRSRLRQHIAEVNIETSLFELPAGSLDMAAGYQFRRESGLFDSVQTLFTNAGLGASIEPVSGHFTSHEVYGELVIPLVANKVGFGSQKIINNWTVEAAARLINHSQSGSDISFTIGSRLNLDLPLVKDSFTFRGHYSEAIRTPAITEVIAPTIIASEPTLFLDPCSVVGRIFSGPAALARCTAEVEAGIAAGDLPANFSLDNFRGRAPRPEFFSGNPTIGNEGSRAWTVGLVASPYFMPGLTFSVDWTNLKLTSGISRASAVTACYQSFDPVEGICGLVTRNANTFALENSIQTYINFIRRELGILNVSLDYQIDLTSVTKSLAGTIGLKSTFFYLDHDSLEGVTTSRFDRISPVSKRLNASVSYALDNFSTFVEWQHIGAYGDPNDRAGNYFAGVGPAVSIFNGSVRYGFDRFEAQLVVNDIFDTRGEDPATQLSIGRVNPVGRNFVLNLTARF